MSGWRLALFVGLMTAVAFAPVPDAWSSSSAYLVHRPDREPIRALRSARLIVDGDRVLAGHAGSQTVTALILPSGRRLWQTYVGCEPATLSLYDDRVYVACVDTGELAVIDSRSGALLQRRWVGQGPFGVLATSRRVFVTLSHDNALVVLDARSLGELRRVKAALEPRGLALHGNRLYVVHLLDASVNVFDARDLRPLGRVVPGLQAAIAESVTLRADGQRAYVPHQRMNVTNLNRTFDSTVFPVVTAVDTQVLTPVRREALALDSADTPVGMPAAAVLGKDGTTIYVANAASDDVSIVDLNTGIGVGHVEVGQNPRDLALSEDGQRLYTLNAVSGDITVVDTGTRQVVATLQVAEDQHSAQIHLGERLFKSSRPDTISRDNWIACASCHLDGGFDGQTWLGTDGGPRNTTILRGIRNTEPLHWSADRPNVQDFQQTFTGLMSGTGLSSMELDALAAYLDSLQPLKSPARLAGGSLSEAATRGASVFRAAGCAVCHEPGGGRFTDRKRHDVGTGEPSHPTPSGHGMVAETMGPEFDTPSLRELWLTAPYLHDGRAGTLRDVLTTQNSGDRHGSTSGVSVQDIEAIESFLTSLPLTAIELQTLFADAEPGSPY